MINYRQGETLMADYVSQGELAGELVDLGGGLLGVIHSDTETGRLGAANVANGTTIYEATKALATQVLAVGDIVNIDASNEVAAAGTAVGIAVKASANGDETAWFRFDGA